MKRRNPRHTLLECYQAALQAVNGRRLVREALRGEAWPGPCDLVAVGKAAAEMGAGALEALDGQVRRALVITKHGHCRPLPPPVRCLEAGHPRPDAASLEAGQALLAFLAAPEAAERLLFLVSGGSSALVEVLAPGLELADLAEISDWLLANGWEIGRINRVRKQLSRIKGGRLAAHLGGRPTLNLLLSDVPGDDPATIGSGLLVPDAGPAEPLPAAIQARLPASVPASPDPDGFAAITTRILAGNAEARAAAAAAGRARGLAVYYHETLLEGEAAACGRRLAAELLAGPPGLYVWGGETTVTLPSAPGQGGRCQHLALAAACELAGSTGISLLAAGTDGSDGPTDDVGALVDGDTLARGEEAGYSAAAALAGADAGSFLAVSGDLLQTGPTGSNVMDLVLGLKLE